MDRFWQNRGGRRGSEVLDLPRTESAHGDNAGSQSFHKPGIKSPWRAGSVKRPVGGIVTPNFKGRKRNKNDSGLNNPMGLAFDRAGNLYAANYQHTGSTIQKITPGGVASVFASIGLDYPVGLAFDSQGNLYAANQYSETIEKFTPDGVGSIFASTGLSDPMGLAFDSADNLYVANQSGYIEKYTPDGVGSLFAKTGFTGSDYPMFIAIQTTPEPSTSALLALCLTLLRAFRRQRHSSVGHTPFSFLIGSQSVILETMKGKANQRIHRTPRERLGFRSEASGAGSVILIVKRLIRPCAFCDSLLRESRFCYLCQARELNGTNSAHITARTQ
jgi:hypothetical protein